MPGGSAFLSRERLAFLAAACALAAAGVWAVLSLPVFRPCGEQRIGRPAPGEPLRGLEALEGTGDASRLLAGARGNPFGRCVESSVPAGDDEPRPRTESVKTSTVPDGLFPIRTQSEPTVIKPYQVPVNFRGIMVTGDERYILLKVKHNGENRRLVEGDIWPEINLRVVQITRDWVLLREEKTGTLYKMRDAYGRRPGAGAEVASLEAGQSR